MSATAPGRRRARAPWTAASAVVSVLSLAFAAGPTPSAAAGAPRVHALTNARIVTAPGQVIERGTVVFRDGVIEAVGTNVKVPADARVWDAESLTVYPGLIDAFVLPQESGPAGRPAAGLAVRPGQTDTGEPARGAASTLPAVRAEYRVIENLPLSKEQLESLRAAGFTVAQVAPRRGLVRGTSAVIGLGDGRPNAAALAADASQVVAIDAMPGGGYPGSLMGGIAVVRQAFLDAKWYRDANAAYARRPQGQERPETNLSWAALEPAIAGRQPVTFVADDMLEVLRAAAIAKEAGVGARVVGAGDEYKRTRAVAATGLPLVLPVAFPEAPDVADEANALEVSTEELRAWQEAPGNPAALAREGVAFSLSTHRLREPKDF
ncbi:MAG: hypothetical protein MUC69_10205, partial [Gemmatimonadales bacterium]|nr:hypothetical protein [Gemmatimonadales bacterium]